MVNVVSIYRVLGMISEVIVLIASIVSLLKFKKMWQKITSSVVLIVCISSIVLSFYLQPSPNEIYSNLTINVYEPLVVSKDGNCMDKYTIDPEYSVLCGKDLPLDANVSLEITNMKTFEKNKYDLFNVYEGQQLSGVCSGKYRVKTYVNNKLVQTNDIELSSENLEDDGRWCYSIYVMNDFFDVAQEQNINLSRDEHKKVVIPAYTIHSDDASIYCIFEEGYNEESEMLLGKYYFAPGLYYLNNAVYPTDMQTKEIVVL